MQPLRRVLAASPRDEEVMEKITVLAFQTDSLDSLAKEYGEKANAEPLDDLYARHLKRIRAMSLLESDVPPLPPEYMPAPYIKPFFDCVALPAGVLGIILGNCGKKFKPFLLLGITFFLFYCAYRIILWMLMRRR